MRSQVPRSAVRGVYRCIVRHLNHLDPSLIKTVHRQFKRRIDHAKLGHVRVAYDLEEQLRKCALGEKTLADVVSQFKSKQKGAPKAIEKNAMGKHHIWKSLQERRLDAYNAPPVPGTLAYSRVHMAAGLNNLRHRFLQKCKLKLHNCDVGAIDIALAPAIKEARDVKKLAKRKIREETPRKARVISIRRDGVILHTIRIQGFKANTRGFGKLMGSLLRNRKLLDKIDGLQNSLSQKKCPEERAAAKRAVAAARKKLGNHDYFKIQRQVLLKRAERLQKRLDYSFRLQQQNKQAQRARRPPITYLF